MEDGQTIRVYDQALLSLLLFMDDRQTIRVYDQALLLYVLLLLMEDRQTIRVYDHVLLLCLTLLKKSRDIHFQGGVKKNSLFVCIFEH